MDLRHPSYSHPPQVRKPVPPGRGPSIPKLIRLRLDHLTMHRVFSVGILVAWLPQLPRDVEKELVFSARTAIRSASVDKAKDLAIPIHVDFHTSRWVPKRDTSLHGKGGDGARHVRGSLSCTSYLAASSLVALQDSQHVCNDMRVHLQSFYSLFALHQRHMTCQDSAAVVLQGQALPSIRLNASSTLQFHEVGSVRLPFSQDHG
jgi:hypothetical protein